MNKQFLIALFVCFGFAAGYLLYPFVLGGTPTEDEKSSAHSVSLPQEDLQPFLEAHCVRCHGPDKQKGQVRLDEYSWVIDSPDHAQRWQDVLDQLNGGDMPPDYEEQPSNEELTNFLATLSGSLNTARQRLADHGGEIKMRRLNRREYAATMADLFGLLIEESDLPEDGEVTSFDTVGDEQFFTSVHFKEYLAFARKFVPNAMRWSTKPHWSSKTHGRDFGPGQKRGVEATVARYEKKLQGLRDGVPLKELGFGDAGAAKQYKQQSWIYLGGPKKYLTLPNIDQGAYFVGLGFSGASYWNHLDPRGEYTFRFHGGVVGNPDDTRKHLSVNTRGNAPKIVRMHGTVESPETVEVKFQVGKNGNDAQKIQYKEHYHIGSNGLHRQAIGSKDPLAMDPQWAALWIDRAEMEGPSYPEVLPKIAHLLYPDAKITKKLPTSLSDETEAREFIEKFAYEVFRRQTPEPAYIDGLYQIFLDQRADGKTVLKAISEPLAIILSSPKFLYLTEEPSSESRQITDRELAVRLAYFLWSRPPDEALYAVAESGQLSDPAVLDQQIERMINHENSKALSDGFMSQWSELDRFDAISISTKEFPKFNANLRRSAKQEAREFFHALIRENLPARNLIDSDFVTINGILAAHYGIENFTSRTGEFVKVNLPPGSPRGGMMTQAHFLASGSNGERSSPVIRGAMVLDKLLHDKPPPPPPNVPELDEASDKPMSNREMVLLHQKRASCASCHKKMDVIGFGLENFDQTGAWRTHERIGEEEVLIEPGGTLPDGTSFSNVIELKKALLTKEDALAKELTSSLLAYALGRTISFTDQDSIEGILKTTKPAGYPVRDMVKAIATSQLFQSQ